MIWTWAGWEPLQYYRRLGGFHEAQEGNALWAEDWRARLDSEACAALLAEAGINWVTTHLYKGFGLEAEAEEIAATQAMIANYHRHGVKVFTYLQYGTVMPETILAETEEAATWGRIDWNGQHDGHPYEYGDQYWRAKPCANQPGFLAYLRRCVDTALGIGADGIWIDNLQADGCHCSRCQAAFQAYLQQEIADPWRALGVRDLSRVAIPRAERPRDPVFQAWVRFRCEETRRSLRMLADHARATKPDVVVAVNIGIGNHQRALLENGNWFGNLDCVDYTYAENGLFPRWTGEAIVSQHWPMGICESIGIRVVPGSGVAAAHPVYHRPAVPAPRQLRRLFAESMLQGGHAVGGPFGLRGEDGGADPLLLRDAGYRQTHRALVDWYVAHHGLFAGSSNAAPVAVCYSREAMTGDETRARQAFEAMVQLLQQQQLPFRYVLSDRLDALSDVALLVLPHVLPLSEAQAEHVRAFVARGGRVLATGRTSLYDGCMRQRREYGLADLFGQAYSHALEDGQGDAILVNASNGCLFVPGPWGIAGADGQPACRVSGERLARAIRQAIAGAGMPEVLSPLPQVGCAWRRLPDGTHLLGMMNYGETPVAGITLQGIAPGTEVRLWSIEHEGAPLAVVHGRALLPPLEAEAYVTMTTPRDGEPA
jgi:hypothetical protein